MKLKLSVLIRESSFIWLYLTRLVALKYSFGLVGIKDPPKYGRYLEVSNDSFLFTLIVW